MCMLVHFNMKTMAIRSAPRVLLVTYVFVSVAGNVDPEPLCLSRYDYDYKILLKTFTLEQEQKELRQVVAKLSESITKMEAMQKSLKQLVDDQSTTIAGMEQSKLDKDEEIATIEEALKNGQGKSIKGSTFVRWGRTGCPGNGTDTVYSGQVGGSWYLHKGAAANYLCLPSKPLWDKYDDGDNKENYVCGGEYQPSGKFSEKLFNQDLHQHDAPCAVCHSVRSSTMMIPGRNACYDGWTKEYAGYLVAGKFDHDAAGEYVCLDKRPEVISGSSANVNGKLMYTVEARCGTLKCPPYVEGRELTCVVCTR